MPHKHSGGKARIRAANIDDSHRKRRRQAARSFGARPSNTQSNDVFDLYFDLLDEALAVKSISVRSAITFCTYRAFLADSLRGFQFAPNVVLHCVSKVIRIKCLPCSHTCHVLSVGVFTIPSAYQPFSVFRLS